jgi:hemerythrin superfamily protein
LAACPTGSSRDAENGAITEEGMNVGADVVDLIMSDHREVERLFDILKNKPGDRLNALPVMATLLVAHSRAEEAEVYPVARDEAGIADDVEHSQEEHLAAEQVLERLMDADPESKEFETLLEQVVDEVTHHVEEEESSVLPKMKERLSDSRREELAHAFAKSRAEHLGQMPGEMTKQELTQQARNVGMSGAQSMDKVELHEELQKKAST